MTRAATQRLPDAPPGLPLPSVRARHTAAKFASAHAGKTVDVLLRAKRDVAAAKVFFRRFSGARGDCRIRSRSMAIRPFIARPVTFSASIPREIDARSDPQNI